MDFWSSYAHGFARVAACTIPVAIADPARNAEVVLEQARACHEDAVALAVFPELSLCGYAIDDLLMQDTLLDGVLAAIDTVVAGSRGPHAGDRGRRSAGARHACRELRGRDPPWPHPRRGPEVLPADLPRVLRAALVRARRRPARFEHPARRPRRAVRPRPDLHRHRPARLLAVRRDLRGHVGAGAAERRGLAGRRDRAWRTSPAARSRWPGPRTGGCSSARPARAATRRTSMRPRARASRPRTCRGTARRWSTSAASCSPRASGSPTARAGRWPTSTSTASGRNGSDRGRTTTTGGRWPTGWRRSGPSSSSWRRRPVTSGCGARSTGSRSCPTTPSGWPWTATRPTTSRSPGSSSGCTRSASPRSSSASAAASTPPTR